MRWNGQTLTYKYPLGSRQPRWPCCEEALEFSQAQTLGTVTPYTAKSLPTRIMSLSDQERGVAGPPLVGGRDPVNQVRGSPQPSPTPASTVEKERGQSTCCTLR